MKKNLLVVLSVVLVALFAVSVVMAAEEPIVIKVGASPAPHAEILKVVADVMKESEVGYELEVIEFTDYVLPNTALEDGSLDANYFQHTPYLEDFNASYAENNSKWINLVPVVPVHFEPMGVYGGKTAALEDIKEGAKIAVPNDPTNEARALLLLEAQGLLTIKEGKGLEATAKDIEDNPLKIKLVEIEAAQLPMHLTDVDFAVINGNYAISAGLKAEEMLAQEGIDSEAAQLYANVLVVREGSEEDEGIKALSEALKSDEVKAFIEENYAGAVVPMF